MEIDPRAWTQNGCGDMERVHYGDSDHGQWSNPSMETNKQGYYPRTMGSYHPSQQLDRTPYYQDHSHAVPVNMTSCETPMYESNPMAPPHAMYDSMPHHYPSAPSSEMEHWHIQMMSQSDPFLALPIRESERSKRKRRRVISMEQRKAANIRERRRMYQLNEAFDILRKRVPTFAYEKKLSRIETLKLAVTYIEFMGEILENNGEKCKELIEKVKDHISTLSDDDTGSSKGEELLMESPSSSQSMKDTSLGDDLESDHSENE